jgi:uncharacterized protein YndB with AHSA1/START domain
MAGRASLSTAVDVNKTPEVVFAYLADVTKHGEWSPKPYRVEGVTGPVAKGATFVSYGWVPGDKDHRNDVEVTAYDAPRLIEFTGTERGEKFVNTFTLTATGSGTRVERRMDMPKPGGFLGAVFPAVVGGFVKMLKSKVESA